VRGTLHKHPGRPGDYWELIAELAPDPVTHKRRRQVRTFRGTKRDAQRALTAFVAEVDRGGRTGTSSTVDDLLVRWMGLAELAVTTRRRYRGLIDLHISPALGAVSLRRLEASQLDQLYADLLAKGLAPATVRQVHAVLRRALGQALKWGWLSINTATMASPPRLRKSDVAPPTRGEAVRLVLAGYEWGDGTLGAMLHVAATTGARRGELCGLRWGDIDVEAGELLIERSVVTGEDGRLVVKSTKTHAARRIALDAGTVAVLVAHRGRMEERARLAFDGTDLKFEGRDLLSLRSFVWSDDLDGKTPWRPDRVTQAFRKLCAREGVAGVRLHDLRHFAATELIAAGVDAVTVGGRLGHANSAVTLSVYSHFVRAADRKAADVLGNLLA
jgi:integrase